MHMAGRERRQMQTGSTVRWLPWLLGVAILAALVAVVVHRSEQREFLDLLQRAHPIWVLWAFLLQALTYLAQGEIWRAITRAGGVSVSFVKTYQLSLAKLFIDQAIPTAGISGTVTIGKGLEGEGVSRRVVASGVVIATASYYCAYLSSLAAALAFAASRGHAHAFILGVAFLFTAFAVALTWTVLSLPGRRNGLLARVLRKAPLVRRATRVLEEAEPELAHNPKLLLGATGLQFSIILLDAATMWFLIRSLGEIPPSVPGVFASFMLSTLLRDVGIVPGGLGIFEAASVVTLRLAGVPVAAALSATLLFRGLSFWLPMIPGIIFSRRAVRRSSP